MQDRCAKCGEIIMGCSKMEKKKEVCDDCDSNKIKVVLHDINEKVLEFADLMVKSKLKKLGVKNATA